MISWLKNRFTKTDALVVAAGLIFLIYKLANLTWRFGDGNAYLYMMDQLIQGHLPYRDFFTADPPGFLLFLSLVRIFFGAHWDWYQAVPIGLQVVNSFLIWRLLRPASNLAWLAPVAYLFSFTILATTDFSTGVQLVILFVLLGHISFQKNQPILSGIFWALAVLTKLYAIPALLGFGFYLILDKKFTWRFVIGLAATSVVILGPFVMAAPQKLFEYIIIHQFHRTSGLNTWDVWRYFLSHEWAIWLLAIPGVFLKSLREYRWPLVLTAIFFIFFRDLYYLYLSFLFPYLIISAITLTSELCHDLELKPLGLLAAALVVINLVLGFYWYQSGPLVQGRFTNITEIAKFLKTQTVHAQIYGSHELAPPLALLSGKKIWGNYIDTNTQVFAAGTFDREQISQQAAGQGVYLIARISEYPQYGIKATGFEGYFSPTVFEQACRKVKFFDSTSNENDNYIGLYDCQISK